jgi:hypothetical protein
MQRRTTKRSAFTKPRKHPGDSHLQSSPPPASPSWKLYRRITDLPLDPFINAYCDDDLSGLVISGDPPPDELQQVWEQLKDEFEDGMQDDDYRETRDVVIEIDLMETAFTTVHTICSLLEYFPAMTLVEELAPELERHLGFPISLDPADKNAFQNGLDMARGHAGRIWTEAQAMKVQLPRRTQAPGTKPHKISRGDFDQLIIALSAHFKFKVSKYETTVSEFMTMVQDLRRSVRARRQIQNN